MTVFCLIFFAIHRLHSPSLLFSTGIMSSYWPDGHPLFAPQRSPFAYPRGMCLGVIVQPPTDCDDDIGDLVGMISAAGSQHLAGSASTSSRAASFSSAFWMSRRSHILQVHDMSASSVTSSSPQLLSFDANKRSHIITFSQLAATFSHANVIVPMCVWHRDVTTVEASSMQPCTVTYASTRVTCHGQAPATRIGQSRSTR